MKTITLQSIEKAKERLSNIKPSHNDAHKIADGWQMGLYEKEITNYDGFGFVMKVTGRTKEEAEALAVIICRKLNTGEVTLPGEYDGIHTMNATL